MADILEAVSSTPPAHVYGSIDESKIRLLTLAPSDEESAPVEVLIFQCKRKENPGYGAISYTWGGEDKTHGIYCDGCVIKVTKSCEDALRALRHPKDPQNLWIDAVCINQDDLSERTQQVANMGEVYRRANETFAYLGEVDRSYDMYELSTTTKDSDWTALLSRVWFRRTWVIQELMLSRRMTLVAGRQKLPLLDVLSLCDARGLELPSLLTMRNRFIHEYARRPPKSWDTSEEVEMQSQPLSDPRKGKAPARDEKSPSGLGPLLDGRGSEGSSTKETGRVDLNYWMLHDVLKLTADFGCRDGRDKLFAILPLFKKPIPALLYPDYSKTLQQVFTDLSWFLLQQDLPHCLEHARGPNGDGLPSWATDWSRDLRRLSFEDDNAVTEKVAHWRKTWRAGFQPRMRQIQSFRIDQKRISLRGLIAGKVALTQRKQYNYVDLEINDVKKMFCVTWVLRSKSDGRSDFQCKIWRSRLEDADDAFLDEIGARIRRLSGEGDKFEKRAQRCKKDEGDGGLLFEREAEWSVLRVGGQFENSQSIYDTVASELRQRSLKMVDNRIAKVESVREIVGTVTPFTRGRCVVRAESGEWGLAPDGVHVGDNICIFLGFKIPFVLRRTGTAWSLIGECLMEDMTTGHAAVDAMDWSKVWSSACPSPLRDFTIE